MILKKSGFTLVEIMIVLAIIGMVVAVAVPNYMTARAKSVTAACHANAKQLQTALSTADLATMGAISTNNLSEKEIEADIYPDFVKSMPHCSNGYYYTDARSNVMCSVHNLSKGAFSPGAGIVGTSDDDTAGGTAFLEVER